MIPYQDEIVAISRRATGEAKLREDLDKLEEAWKDLQLTLIPYKDRDQIFVLAGIDDLYTFLDENLANINMIRGNQYKAVVEGPAEALRKSLVMMNTVTEDMLTLQKSWMYLENIFSSQEIKRVLGPENSMFEKINVFFTQQMQLASKMQYAQKYLQKNMKPLLTTQLKQYNEQVDYIMKQLANFLETKRNEFARFSFLSDDELLEILAK